MTGVRRWLPSSVLLRAGALALLLTLAGCGGTSPNAPSPPAFDVAGTWTGTWRFQTAGVTVTDTVSVTLHQTISTATGTWLAQGGAGGTLTFTVASSLSGSLTIRQTTLEGDQCSATTNLTGTASSTDLDLTLAAIPPGGICQWAAGQRFSLRRN